MNTQVIVETFAKSMKELIKVSKIKKGEILVLGMSTSEIAGEHIGKGRMPEVGEAIIKEALRIAKEHDIYFAAQCCEHLNRAIVVERSCMEQYGLEEVTVVPVVNAGGSSATAAYHLMENPVVVEKIQAHAAMDVGDTFVGMHLRPVAVPVRLAVTEIGHAHLTAARTRPKLIGGERAHYKA